MAERAIPPARDAQQVRAWHDANRQAWNEAAAAYAAGHDETLAFLRAGKSSLHPIERANLAALADWCEVAIHLQCASGEDALSLLNEGARRVVGIDISEEHVTNARRLTEALGANAEWIRCDVLDVPRALDGTADLVYTGRGAINWIHDIDAWGAVVARLLKPGGIVHVFDNHPASFLFEADVDELILSPFGYFDGTVASKGWPAGYIGDAVGKAEELTEKYERTWTIAAVFGALRGAGLVVEHLGEYPDEYFPFFLPDTPEEVRRRAPMTFSMTARRTQAPHAG